MTLRKNQNKQENLLQNEIKSTKVLVKNNKITSQILFIIIGSFCLFLLANQAIWAQIESIYNSANDEVAGISGLMSAVTNNDIEGVKFFSKGGPLIINQKNIGGATALHISCRESNTEAVKILLENGANVNIADNEGWTPLMRASLVANADIVEMLIAKNAKADAFNSIGETALIHATTSKCLQCLNIIIEKANLVKNTNLKTLKTQITDAFLLARNQEESNIKTVLEAFLDYVNKADNLLVIDADKSKIASPEENLEESKQPIKPETIKKLNISKKNDKKFILKSSSEQQEESTNINKSSQQKIVKSTENSTEQLKKSKSIKQEKLEPVKNFVKQPSKTQTNTLEPKQEKKQENRHKKTFKLKKPIEDSKNKIPTITQQSLPPVVAPVESENKSETISNNTKSTTQLQNNQSAISKQNTLNNKNKSITSTDSDNLLEQKPQEKSDKISGFFKKIILKKPQPETKPSEIENTAKENISDSQNSSSITNKPVENLQETILNTTTPTKNTEQLIEKPIEKNSEKTPEENIEKPVEKQADKALSEIAEPTKQEKQIPENKPSEIQPNIMQNPKIEPSSTTNSKSPPLQSITQNKEKIESQKPQEKLKKFKFSPLQNNTNKPSQNQIKSAESVNLTNTSLENKQNNKQILKRKYKLNTITDSENNESEIKIKKLPVPQEI
jgi:hypothetical protein